ncbi:WcaF family extracellular polysaccharide biosynthesis acetyltransferase [Fibrella forsythiae]|uniref:WcaF family extracellular polysaccharide biosynthesis acetyltransferase n=1 Tax=Fibrella forsythiae TaxID=2817061 RepID=A0ABS3JFG7_9BACT|nr:WcaF family extracellular polysaccharide biosynthesis acetyltransferase [Fibrella forsythiae]MBO0948735.1 WcaF family extracellular polysaccharide biosynthesis acetyltransferase [Fibrella forsythiae]
MSTEETSPPVFGNRQGQTDLSRYNNDWFRPGPRWKILLWHFTNAWLFNSYAPLPSSVKVSLLRLFGARVGAGVMVKPGVNIKYPWLLSIGDHVWIGEGVWIDNLTNVTIGSHVCLSQGAMLLTGNHDYRSATFDLNVSAITLEDGAWIGAKATVCPGVLVKSHAVLAVGSVAARPLDAYTIYQGNPAVAVRKRQIDI